MDSVLKQRLIGAAVIWLLAFIFLPMLLQPPAQRSEQVSMALPKPADQPREVRVARLDGGGESGADTAAPSSGRSAERGTTSTDKAPDDLSVGEERAAHSAASGDSAGSEPSEAAGAQDRPGKPGAEGGGGTDGWVVQVGSFGDKDNADRLAERLRARDYAVSVSEFQLGDKILYRVRVGPMPSRDKAERQVARIQEQLGLNGKVLTYP